MCTGRSRKLMRGIAIVFIGGNINSIYHLNSIHQAEPRFLGCLPDTCSLSVHHSIYNINSIYFHDPRFLWSSRILNENSTIVFIHNSFRGRPVYTPRTHSAGIASPMPVYMPCDGVPPLCARVDVSSHTHTHTACPRHGCG